jgi:hypothetical protein
MGVEKWEGQTSAVLQRFSREKYEPTILGSFHLWEKEG